MTKTIWIAYKVGFTLISSVISQSNLFAQENLEGKWISSSIVFNNRKTKINDKKNKQVIYFKKNNRYAKHYYEIKNSSDSGMVRFSYDFMEKKTRVNGNLVKEKKVIDQGSYQISEREIIFNSNDKKDTVMYRWDKESLILIYHLNPHDKNYYFEEKFNKVR
jgi:hypothetical protein